MFSTVSLGQGMCGLAVRHFVLTTEASACHVGLFCFFIFAARLSVSSLGAAVTFMWECTMASEVTLIHCQAKMLQWIFSPGFNICHLHLICNYISWQTPLIDKCVINATHSRHLITLCCFSFRVGPQRKKCQDCDPEVQFKVNSIILNYINICTNIEHK